MKLTVKPPTLMESAFQSLKLNLKIEDSRSGQKASCNSGDIIKIIDLTFVNKLKRSQHDVKHSPKLKGNKLTDYMHHIKVQTELEFRLNIRSYLVTITKLRQ